MVLDLSLVGTEDAGNEGEPLRSSLRWFSRRPLFKQKKQTNQQINSCLQGENRDI